MRFLGNLLKLRVHHGQYQSEIGRNVPLRWQLRRKMEIKKLNVLVHMLTDKVEVHMLSCSIFPKC